MLTPFFTPAEGRANSPFSRTNKAHWVSLEQTPDFSTVTEAMHLAERIQRGRPSFHQPLQQVNFMKRFLFKKGEVEGRFFSLITKVS
jgi:hypothetical protein